MGEALWHVLGRGQIQKVCRCWNIKEREISASLGIEEGMFKNKSYKNILKGHRWY
jgi:hypothetical protein